MRTLTRLVLGLSVVWPPQALIAIIAVTAMAAFAHAET